MRGHLQTCREAELASTSFRHTGAGDPAVGTVAAGVGGAAAALDVWWWGAAAAGAPGGGAPTAGALAADDAGALVKAD